MTSAIPAPIAIPTPGLIASVIAHPTPTPLKIAAGNRCRQTSVIAFFITYFL